MSFGHGQGKSPMPGNLAADDESEPKVGMSPAMTEFRNSVKGDKHGGAKGAHSFRRFKCLWFCVTNGGNR